jgi:hypothetical protein
MSPTQMSVLRCLALLLLWQEFSLIALESNPIKQVRRGNFQSLCYLEQIYYTGVPLASLNTSDVGEMQTGFECQRLLRQSQAPSEGADILPQLDKGSCLPFLGAHVAIIDNLCYIVQRI